MPDLHTTSGAAPEGRCVPRDPPPARNWFERCNDLEGTLTEVDRFVRVAEMALREDGSGLDVLQREAVRFVLAEAIATIDRALMETAA